MFECGELFGKKKISEVLQFDFRTSGDQEEVAQTFRGHPVMHAVSQDKNSSPNSARFVDQNMGKKMGFFEFIDMFVCFYNTRAWRKVRVTYFGFNFRSIIAVYCM